MQRFEFMKKKLGVSNVRVHGFLHVGGNGRDKSGELGIQGSGIWPFM